MHYKIILNNGVEILGDDVIEHGDFVTIVQLQEINRDLCIIQKEDVLQMFVLDVTTEEFDELLGSPDDDSEGFECEECSDLPSQYINLPVSDVMYH